MMICTPCKKEELAAAAPNVALILGYQIYNLVDARFPMVAALFVSVRIHLFPAVAESNDTKRSKADILHSSDLVSLPSAYA